jgi:hypothetical protein
VQRAVLLAVGRARDHDLAVLLLDRDLAALTLGELATRPVDPDDLGLDLHLHPLGHGDRLFADPAHQT